MMKRLEDIGDLEVKAYVQFLDDIEQVNILYKRGGELVHTETMTYKEFEALF